MFATLRGKFTFADHPIGHGGTCSAADEIGLSSSLSERLSDGASDQSAGDAAKERRFE